MAKAFSVASWNVKHFGTATDDGPDKVDRIVKYAADQDADVLAIYEVRSSEVFRACMDRMPQHNFFITEGPQTQEILVGVRRTMSCFVTQKVEFRSSQPGLRPGVLVTPKVDDQFYPVLFLHLKSMTDPKGFGLRDDMMRLALRFRKPLDKAAGGRGRANYLFVGDLNTMGLDYPYHAHDIAAEHEIDELDRRASHWSKKMRRPTKSHTATWWDDDHKYDPAELDHVVASEHLKFKTLDGAEISVRGWPEQPNDATKDEWVRRYSDHALLYFEVQKV